MRISPCIAAAIVLVSTIGPQAEEKSDAQKSAEWYLDANGNPDSCKTGAPSPYMRLSPEDHAEIEKVIEACHKQKAVATEKDRERRRDLATQRAEQNAAASKAADAHRSYLESHHLTEVTVIDLQANGRNMVGGHVAVAGYVRILSEDMIGIYTSANDVNGVRLDLSGANPQSRRRIFGLCSDIYSPCQIEIAGTVDFDEHVLVKVE